MMRMNKKEIARINLLLENIEKIEGNSIQFSIDTNLFYNIVALFSKMQVESHIELDKEGFRIVDIDDGRICLYDSRIHASDLEGFKIIDKKIMEKKEKEEIVYKFGIQLSQLAIILDNLRKGVKKKTTKTKKTAISLPKLKVYVLFDRQYNELILEKNEFEKISIKLLNLGDSGIKPEALNNITYENSFYITPKTFLANIKYSDVFSETTTFKIDNGKILFLSDGFAGGHISEYDKESPEIKELHILSSNFSIVFANRYFQSIMGNNKDKINVNIEDLVDSLKFEINGNTPLKISAKLLNSSYIKYFLAPRIDEQEDDYDEANQ